MKEDCSIFILYIVKNKVKTGEDYVYEGIDELSENIHYYENSVFSYFCLYAISFILQERSDFRFPHFVVGVINIAFQGLQYDVVDDDKERVGEVVQQPGLNGLDDWSAGEAAGHREVDGGEDHHAGDVHGEYHLISVLNRDEVCRLVYNVNQYRWEIRHHKDAVKLS